MKKLMISFMVLVISAFFVVSTPKVLAYNNSDEISVTRLQNTVTNNDDDNNTTTDDNLNTDTDDNTTTDDDDNNTTYDDDTTEDIVDDNGDVFTNLLYGIIGLLIGIVITYLFTNSRKIR